MVSIIAIWLVFYASRRWGNTNPLIYLTITGTIGSLTVMSCKGLGVGIKQTLSGENQLMNPALWMLLVVVVTCIGVQVNSLIIMNTCSNSGIIILSQNTRVTHRWYFRTYGSGWLHSTVVRTSVYDWRTFPGLRHDMELTGYLLGVSRPPYFSQHGQLSHSSSWGRLMSSKLNSGVRYAYMHGGAAWGMLTGKGRYGVVCR